jgi:hypothetical protein
MSPDSTARFPVEVEPDPLKHSILSGLSRLNLINGYGGLAQLAVAAGLASRAAEWDGTQRSAVAGLVDLSMLASTAGLAVEALHELTYPPTTTSALWTEHQFGGHAIPWAALTPTSPKYCPLCINTPGNHRREWGVAWALACPSHEVSLVEACSQPGCGKPCSWDWNWSDDCQYCGGPRSEYSPAPSAASIALATEVGLILTGAASARSTLCASLGELFGALHALVTLLIPGSVLGRFDFSPQKMMRSERDRLIAFAWPILARATSADAVAAYVASHRMAFKNLPQTALLMRLQDAIEATPPGLLQSQLKQSLESSWTTPARLATISESVTLEYFTVSMTARALSTSQHNVRDLTATGLLPRIPAKMGRSSNEWIIPLTDLDHFLGKLRDRSADAPSDVELISLNQLLRTTHGSALGGCSGVFRKIVANELPVFRTADSTTFDSLSVLRPGSPPPTADGGALTVTELSNRWQIYNDAIYRVMKTGKLPFRRSGKGTTRLVDREQVELFEARYSFITEIGRTHSVNPTNLTDRLIDAGVNPVSGPTVDGGLIYLFNRQEVRQLNLPEILNRSEYKSRAGRPRGGKVDHFRDGAIDCKQASKALGLRPEQVARLVARGFLPEHPGSQLARKRLVYEQDVARYKDSYSGNRDLVSADEAANRLGCSRKQLFVRFLRSGRLTSVVAPHGETFITVESLDVLQGDRRTEASLSEAAQVTGLQPWKITMLRLQGKLEKVRKSRGGQFLYDLPELRAVGSGRST